MKIFIIVFITLCCNNVLTVAQQYMEADFFVYVDQVYIDSITAKNKINKFLIYQSTISADSLIIDEDVDSVVSFLIWQDNNGTLIKMISETDIYKTVKIDSFKVFSYKNFNSLWADKKEDNLYFVPPLLTPYNSEIVLFISNKRKYFYEFGDDHYYINDPKKNKYREEFVNLLKRIIVPNLKNNIVESKYTRPEK